MNRNFRTKNLQGNRYQTAKKWVVRFVADTSGNMSLVTLFGSTTMLVFSGVAIDVMHADLERVKTQNTLDRAVLAAANGTNSRLARDVVEDYFQAMGISEHLATVDAEVTSSSKRVTATSQHTVPANFMTLLGIETLSLNGIASADTASSKMEISLVLDISGSMAGTKLARLKTAANGFIDSVLGTTGVNNSVTISVIPYNATVNMGADMADFFSMQNLHDFSACARFDAADFNTTSIWPDDVLVQLGHFDPYNSSSRDLSNPWCSQTNIIPHSNNPALLKAHINSFQARGNTAIDVGMKWALALLDPAAAPAVQAMSAAGFASSAAQNRPAPFNSHDTQKYVVVMTDGRNTTQYDLRDSLKYEMSDVWMVDPSPNSISDNKYSILVDDQPGTENDLYYWTHNGKYKDKPHGAGDALSEDDLAKIEEDAAKLAEKAAEEALKDYEDALKDAEKNVEDSLKDVEDAEEDILKALEKLQDELDKFDEMVLEGKDDDKLEDQQEKIEEEQAEVEMARQLATTAQLTLQSAQDVYARLHYNGGLDFLLADTPGTDLGNGNSAVQLSYADLFGMVNMQYLETEWIEELYDDGYLTAQEYYDLSNPYEAIAYANDADNQLASVCEAGRNENIVIFAVAMEAPQSGIDALQDCASSPAHFFDINSEDLAGTFDSIGTVLTKLRLTQ